MLESAARIMRIPRREPKSKDDDLHVHCSTLHELEADETALQQYLLPPDSVVFFGCVGKDKYAETLKEANKKAGLAVRYRYDEKEPTGRCGVIITGNDRSMCTDLAAANAYKIEHLEENWGVAEKAKAYFVGGYHLTVCVPAVLKLAEEAAKKNKVGQCSDIGSGMLTY